MVAYCRAVPRGARFRRTPTRQSGEFSTARSGENTGATDKRILKLDRLRLRGPNGAKDEFLLAACAFRWIVIANSGRS
jgi:hypothetical protein